MASQQNGINRPKVIQVNGDESFPLVNSATDSAVTMEMEVNGKGKFLNKEGMNWLVTALFIVGETAGGGLIALPSAMVSAGLFGGIIIILLGALICTYTGTQLADNWTILQQRWPQYRSHCRKPYPAMGEKAIGKQFSYVVSWCLDVTQFGTAVVFLLLASKNIETFLAMAHIHIDFCRLIVVVALVMLPVTMLKSPKDFWWAVILAMFTTCIGVGLIIFGSISDAQICLSHANYPPINWSKISMCFGTVMFAYGGHGAFPTIQHDMKKPYQFKRAVTLAFLLICTMYIPVSVTGYITYGDSLLDSIIPSLQIGEIRFLVNMLITLHVILALTIVFNPLNQELEDLAAIPQDFCWQRVAIRSFVMAAVVCIAVSMPSFGVLLDLVGGSTITLMALFFPAIFNLYLRASANKYNNQIADDDEPTLTFSEMIHYTSIKNLILNGIVIAVSVVGGLSATYSAVNAMMASDYATPCWWGLFAEIPENIVHQVSVNASMNCCGEFRNVSRYGTEFCMDPASYVSGGSHG